MGSFLEDTAQAQEAPAAADVIAPPAIPVIDDGMHYALHPEAFALTAETEVRAPREPVCRRCVGLAHSGKVVPVTMGEAEFRAVLAPVRHLPAVVIYCVDIFDLPGSLHPLLHDVFPHARDTFGVVNKVGPRA